MADAWRRGSRDGSDRSPLQGGEQRGERGSREDRHIRVGVSHPSGDPARHRVFEVRASYSDAAGGWVAQVGEQNLNEQLEGWGPELGDGGRARSFPTAAACLGDAVTLLVAMVDREAVGPQEPTGGEGDRGGPDDRR